MTDTRKPVIVLLPLDDRPVNTRDAVTLAGIAGAELRLPPETLLPPRGQAADVSTLQAWLDQNADECDALVVSINALAYGGYVASRRTTEDLAAVSARLGVLRRVRARRPALPIHTYMTLMRTRATNGAGAEPPYWEHHGARLHALSRELYRLEHGLPADVSAARAEVPAVHVTDLVTRRLRLHAVQLACLELVVDDVANTFTVLVEDSSVESMSTTEREWLETWIARLDVGDRIRCLPGADEAGGVLVVRAALEHARRRPRVALACTAPEGLDRVALFEDVPVRDTVVGQIATIGADLVDDTDDADLVLALHPPAPIPHDWCQGPDAHGDATENVAARLAAVVRDLVARGSTVAIADVAYANGADPALVANLRDAAVLDDVAGYAGWNTAGNSIGSALAQGCSWLLADPALAREERARNVTRRLLDDWGYQVVARQSALAMNRVDLAAVERDLVSALAELGPPADRFAIVPGSVRLPWDRPFEIMFDLHDSAQGAPHR